jgi:hypothetical protein
MFLNIELYEVQAHEIKLTPHLNLVAHICAHNCFFYYRDIFWCATNQNLEQKSICNTLLEFLVYFNIKKPFIKP